MPNPYRGDRKGFTTRLPVGDVQELERRVDAINQRRYERFGPDAGKLDRNFLVTRAVEFYLASAEDDDFIGTPPKAYREEELFDLRQLAS